MREVLIVKDLRVAIHKNGQSYYPVRGVSFSVPAGRTLAIVGESGSGKTMTTRAALGLLCDTVGYELSGDVELNGEHVLTCDVRTRRNCLGTGAFYIPQDAMNALNPTMRAGRQVADVLTAKRGMSRQAAKAETLRLFERALIADAGRVYDQYPHELSGGMRQRVLICEAMALQPKLLVADEPTTALDRESEEKVLSLLNKMRDDFACAMLLVSHDLRSVSMYADDILVMYGGRGAEFGLRDEVLDSPAHPYTRCLLQCDRYPATLADGEMFGIEGSAPRAQAKLSGCPFAARCPEAMEICVDRFPPKVLHGESHTFYCHIPDAEAMGGQTP